MARLDDLVGFAKAHQLKIGAIEDLIAYRLQNDRVVKRVAKTTVETATAGSFDLYVYETTTEPAEHLALVKGNLTKGGPVLVRVHAVNVLQDVLGIGEHGGSGTAVEQAMRAIAAEGRGVIVLIRDTRPKSISEWVARGTASGGEKAMSKERRQAEIGIGSQILADIGVKDMVLLTTSPEHVYVGLEAFGLHVAETRKIE
jgi:3,4-dihydroxy 2-butanone 4-phosphate synthase/GTP cyclohydrolase II